MDRRIDINAQTKIGELLDAFPQLEETLLRLSPSFARLKNPVLRKTVGRIASLRQAAEIGGLDVGEMISTLRKAAGMEDLSLNTDSQDIRQTQKPDWIKPDNISVTFDAINIIEDGGNPMKDILEKVNQLEADRIMLLITPFIPLPILELLRSKGYQSWSEKRPDRVYTYIGIRH